MQRTAIQKAPLALILVIYLVLGGAYALYTPLWQVPDEPAHFNYIKYIAEHGQLPELKPGDYPHDYLEEIKARRFPPTMSIEPIRYEAHQPPLYYLLAAPIYLVAERTFSPPLVPLVLRFFSLFLGALSLFAGYKTIRTLWPSQMPLAIGTVAFAATLPMHVAMNAGINNDVLIELIINLTAWQLAKTPLAKMSPRHAAGLGILLGLAFLTKMQAFIVLGMILVLLAWDAHETTKTSSPRYHICLLFGVALALTAPWLIRNALVYGPRDLLALKRHDQVVVGQLTTKEFLSMHNYIELLRHFVQTTFQSFWGQFGWMGVPLDQRIYLALFLLCCWVAIGVGAKGIRLLYEHRFLSRRSVLLASWILITIAGYLWYNTKYLQPQGRYLFAAIIPLGLIFTIGLQECVSRASRLCTFIFGALAGGLFLSGLFLGDIKGYTLIIALGLALLAPLGSALERIKSGLFIFLFYLGMAGFTLFCLWFYVVPHLSP